MLNGFIARESIKLGTQALNRLNETMNRLQKARKTLEKKEQIKKVINK